MSNVKNIAQMGVNEIFEDLAYSVAYGEVYNKLNNVIYFMNIRVYFI